MKYLLKITFKDKIMSFCFFASLLLNLIIWIYCFLNISMGDALIYLHYNIYFGVDFIGAWHKIFIIPIFGLIILLINYYISIQIYLKNKFVSYILAGSALFAQFILLFASIAIVWINS
ncbi:hypothetical protein KAS41_04325 [Candidatus Parcubacteria bacterium]|nr:hypothetical protein [Candidatus Parcubacteria bacterium]